MNVTSYIFQSPYPSPVQIGRPDPQAKVEDEPSKVAEAPIQTSSKTQPGADAYVAQATKSGGSVNVASSSTDSGVSSSLQSFSSINKQSKVIEAYTDN